MRAEVYGIVKGSGLLAGTRTPVNVSYGGNGDGEGVIMQEVG